MTNYYVIKVFNSNTDEMVRIRMTTNKARVREIVQELKVDHEREHYVVLTCNLAKMLNIFNRYQLER